MSQYFASAARQHSFWYLLPAAVLVGMYYTIFPDMVMDWYNDDNYSHGFLVPLVSAYFVWNRWGELQDTLVQPSPLGLGLILFGGVQYISGMIVQELFLMRTSFVVILAGIVWYLYGTRVLKVLALPISYLFFMVPLPFTVYTALSFPLKLLVTKTSVFLLKLTGLPVLREGNVIMFPNITLEVVEACSGMRSLMSLIAMGTAYAFLVLKRPWQRVLVIISSVPIAVGTNMMRVYVTGVLARHYGAAAAEGFFHDFAGFVVFFVALVTLILFGALLNIVGRKIDAR